jgi:hypothetical protein
MSAVPRNAPFGAGGAGGRVNGMAKMLSQRLLPLAANWDFRPSAVNQFIGSTAPELTLPTAARPLAVKLQ